MYCFIQYIEIPKDEPEISSSLLSMASLKALCSTSLETMETKKLIVNPNCPVQILLDYVCSEINIDKNSNYDFCDPETGEMVGIKLIQPWSYPTNILKPKHTYIIVFYEKDENGQYIKLEPLINRLSKQYSETLFRIKRKMSITTRRASSAIQKPKGKRGSASSKGSTANSVSSFKEARQKKKDSSVGARSKKSVDLKD